MAGHRPADEAASARGLGASAPRLGLRDPLPAATASGKAALLVQPREGPGCSRGRKRPHLPQRWTLRAAATRTPEAQGCSHTRVSGPG